VEVIPNKGLIGKEFRQDSKSIMDALTNIISDGGTADIDAKLKESSSYTVKVSGKEFAIPAQMLEVKKYMKKFHVEEFVPSVIEPSFGIGRIMYAIFEHNFHIRGGDEQRTYLALPPVIAPYKCSVLPLSGNAEFKPFIEQISESLTNHGVSHKVDASSGSIGRRYARTDQIAIPFGITVDFDTVNKSPPTATLRDRDSMKQIRAEIGELPKLVSDLVSGKRHWSDVVAHYPAFEQQETA